MICEWSTDAIKVVTQFHHLVSFTVFVSDATQFWVTQCTGPLSPASFLLITVQFRPNSSEDGSFLAHGPTELTTMHHVMDVTGPPDPGKVMEMLASMDPKAQEGRGNHGTVWHPIPRIWWLQMNSLVVSGEPVMLIPYVWMCCYIGISTTTKEGKFGDLERLAARRKSWKRPWRWWARGWTLACRQQTKKLSSGKTVKSGRLVTKSWTFKSLPENWDHW